jgi:hypothetical protein
MTLGLGVAKITEKLVVSYLEGRATRRGEDSVGSNGVAHVVSNGVPHVVQLDALSADSLRQIAENTKDLSKALERIEAKLEGLPDATAVRVITLTRS